MSELVNIYSKCMNNETISFQRNYLESILSYICREIQFHCVYFFFYYCFSLDNRVTWTEKYCYKTQLSNFACMRGSRLIYVICVFLSISVSNTYCVVFLFCLSSSCQFLWNVHFLMPLRYSLNLVRTTRFWNNLHKVRSKRGDCKGKKLVFGNK